MITRPDEYKHQNDSYAIVDNANVRGGIFDVADLSTANLNTIPVDKRKVRSTMVNGTDSKIYIYTGATLDNTAWGTTGNWVVGSGSSYTHPTGFTSQPSPVLTGANVISQITVNDNGHVTSTTSRALSYSDIGAASSSHTHSNATTSTAGFMSTTDKTKLDSITSGAEANQAAFSKVTVGSTTINALTETDTLTLVAGSNITLTTDNLTKSVVVAASGGSSSSYAFGTVAVSGQTNVAADTVNDTLTLVAGNGIGINTNAVTDTVTIYSREYRSTLTSDRFTAVEGDSSTTILNGILSALPTDKNLKGNVFHIVFPPFKTFTLDSTININGYYNGKIVIRTTDPNGRATVNLTGSSFVELNNCVDLEVEMRNIKTNMVNGKFIVDYMTYGSAGGTRHPIVVLKDCYFTIAMSGNSLIQVPTETSRVVVSNCVFDNINADTDALYFISYVPASYGPDGDFTDIFISENTLLNGPVTTILARITTGAQALISVSEINQRVTLLNNATGVGDTWVSQYNTFILR